MAENAQYVADETISTILKSLLNSFPGLDGKEIVFSSLRTKQGFTFYPVSGTAVTNTKEDITGGVTQICEYKFSIVYRFAPQSEEHRFRVKELLDNIGKWLERQPVRANGEVHHLVYPTLPGGMKIKSITRLGAGRIEAAFQDGVEDWSIPITLQYENKFER